MNQAAQNTKHIQFIKGQKSCGKDFHVFIRMETSRVPALKRAIEFEKEVDYSQFGDVIAEGFGKEPTPETLKFIVESYKEILEQH